MLSDINLNFLNFFTSGSSFDLGTSKQRSHFKQKAQIRGTSLIQKESNWLPELDQGKKTFRV